MTYLVRSVRNGTAVGERHGTVCSFARPPIVYSTFWHLLHRSQPSAEQAGNCALTLPATLVNAAYPSPRSLPNFPSIVLTRREFPSILNPFRATLFVHNCHCLPANPLRYLAQTKDSIASAVMVTTQKTQAVYLLPLTDAGAPNVKGQYILLPPCTDPAYELCIQIEGTSSICREGSLWVNIPAKGDKFQRDHYQEYKYASQHG